MNILIQKSAYGLLAVVLFLSLAFSFGSPVRAQSTSTQLEQIQKLLVMIEQLQAQLATMRGESSTTGQCVSLSRSLYLGVSDNESFGEVSKLQRFLTSTGHYTYGEITGYYGPATQRAVQAWQASNGVVTAGSPETTGYGVVGPSTRSAIARGCISKPVVVPVVVDDEENGDTEDNTKTTSLSSPTADLKISGADGPLAKEAGNATFSWTSKGADYCTASGDTYWSGSKSTSGSETIWTGNEKTGVTTYKITCGASSGKVSPASDSVTVTFLSSPTADLKISGADGPLAKEAGNATFSWTSKGADYCTASGDTYWSGSKSTSGSETIWTGNEKTGVTTYKITCGASSGKVSPASDSVTVTFQ